MYDLAGVKQLWRHLWWANQEVSEAIIVQSHTPVAAVREMAHVLGTEETWLSRIQSRPPSLAVWPPADAAALGTMLDSVHSEAQGFFIRLNETELGREVTYTNSAGEKFTNRVGEILVHVALHGQYHRGKINLLFRQAGLEPVPVDYIAWTRGAPAATEADVLDP